jgi:hypothetical protein
VPEVRTQFYKTTGAGFLHETNAWDLVKDNLSALEHFAVPISDGLLAPQRGSHVDRLRKHAAID